MPSVFRLVLLCGFTSLVWLSQRAECADTPLTRLALPTGRVEMVLDSDMYNEVDDQFALAYALHSADQIDLKAVCAAPFLNHRSKSAGDGMERSLLIAWSQAVQLAFAGSAPALQAFDSSRSASLRLAVTRKRHAADGLGFGSVAMVISFCRQTKLVQRIR